MKNSSHAANARAVPEVFVLVCEVANATVLRSWVHVHSASVRQRSLLSSRWEEALVAGRAGQASARNARLGRACIAFYMRAAATVA